MRKVSLLATLVLAAPILSCSRGKEGESGRSYDLNGHELRIPQIAFETSVQRVQIEAHDAVFLHEQTWPVFVAIAAERLFVDEQYYGVLTEDSGIVIDASRKIWVNGKPVNGRPMTANEREWLALLRNNSIGVLDYHLIFLGRQWIDLETQIQQRNPLVYRIKVGQNSVFVERGNLQLDGFPPITIPEKGILGITEENTVVQFFWIDGVLEKTILGRLDNTDTEPGPKGESGPDHP